MIPHRRQELAAGNHFTFNNPTYRRQEEDWNSSEDKEYGAWAERIKGNYGHFGKSGDLQHGAWTQRGRTRTRSHGGGEEFRWLGKEESYDSDTPSPPLWKDSELPETSLNPRAQAIAKYRQEMLDMVQGMPEAGYELSLRDIVEPSPARIGRHEEEMELIKEKNEQVVVQKKEKKKATRISRSESLDTGLLIKMFLPISVGGRKSLSSSGTRGKVSPKPAAADGQKGGAEKNRDEVWWKKNEFSDTSNTSSSRTSSTNSSRTSSTNSSSSSSSSNNSNRSRSRRMSGCYSFFHCNKGKTMKG